MLQSHWTQLVDKAPAQGQSYGEPRAARGVLSCVAILDCEASFTSYNAPMCCIANISGGLYEREKILLLPRE